MQRLHRWVLALGVSLASTACGSASEYPPLSDVPTWEVADSPFAEVSDDVEPLFRVSSALMLSDGSIAVANQSSKEVLYFSDDGRSLLRRVGGDGDGPEEFRGLGTLGRLGGDTLLVWESRLEQVVTIDPAGRVVDRRPAGELLRALRGGCRLAYGPPRYFDGLMVWRFNDNRAPSECGDFPPGSWRESALVTIVDWRSGSEAALGVFPSTERTGEDFRVFGADLLIATGRDQVYLAETDADSILVFDRQGGEVGAFSSPFEARTLQGALPGESIVEMISGRGRSSEMISHDYPETYPRLSRALVDAEGLLWVAAYPALREPLNSWRLDGLSTIRPDYPRQWRVLNRSGEVIAQLTTPTDLRITDIGPDWILGVALDALGVEVVRAYSLVRGSG